MADLDQLEKSKHIGYLQRNFFPGNLLQKLCSEHIYWLVDRDFISFIQLTEKAAIETDLHVAHLIDRPLQVTFRVFSIF